MFGANVSFYEHSVTFTQKLKITGKTYKIEGYLEYGACNDQSCLPPTSVDVKYSGKGIDKPVAEDKKEDKKDEMAAEEAPGTEETAAVADTVATDTCLLYTSDAADDIQWLLPRLLWTRTAYGLL